MSKYAGKLITNQAPAGYSVFFDGSGDYLTVPAGSAFAPGTGNFTIEAWVYPTASGNRFIWTQTVSGTNYFVFAIDTTAYLTMTASGGGTGIIGPANSIKQNAWNHIAAVRVSGTVTVYVNGVGGTPTSNTLDLSNTTYTPTIGTYTHSTASDVFTGYMSNLRYVKGTALYTANFTPPTQLFNVTNTSLLTCNSPTLIDQSSNAFAITANGNAAVSTFTPFAAYNPYNPALGASTPGVWTLDEAMQAAATRQWNMYDPYFQNTTLLLHGNGTNAAQNNTFLDSSSNNFTITRNGNTTQGTFTPFSQTGWGNYFPGTSGVSAGSSATLAFGTGNFTIECWAFLPSVSANSLIASSRVINGTSNNYWSLYAISTNQIEFQSRSAGGTQYYARSNTNTFLPNTWNHIAVTRSSGLITVYVNGVAGTTTVNDGSVDLAEQYIGIGLFNFTTYESYLVGYVSNFRAVKGGVLYTGNFTPSTAPLTTTVSAGTVSLLTCQSNRFIDNSANAFSLSVGGTPSVQAFSPFYPTAAYAPQTIGGSGYFDGSGDAITAASNSAFGFTGDFTIEAWVYKGNNGSSGYDILASVGDGNAINGWFIELSTNRTPRFYSPQGLVALGSTANINDNSWHHWAFVRSGSTLTIYLDGVSQASGSVTGTINYTGSALAIGGIGTLTGGWFNGYISNFRIVRGQALTSGNFTPPKSPLTPTSVGWTGANAASSLTGTVSILTNFTNAGIVDSTAKNVLETVGNAQISTTQSKFGGSSMYFDGTGDYIVEPTNLNFGYGTGDFTIEFWLRLNSTATQTVVSNLTSASSVNPHLYVLSGGSIRYYTANADRITGSTLSANQWYHVALCRSGTSTRLFIDGTQSGSTYTDSNNYGTTAPLGIGTYWASGAPVTADTLNGYIDDLRITRGVARYTANFTPQTSQWQDQ